MPDNETVLYRGASFELGRGPGYYGIWPTGVPRPPSIEWWPETPEGWQGAWARFTTLEPSGAFAPVSPVTPMGPAGPAGPGPAAGPGYGAPASPAGRLPANAQTRARTAAGLLGAGIVLGIIGLFPVYYGGSSLASSASDLVPHVLYLVAWLASALLIVTGVTRLRAGTLLALGTSIVSGGLFLVDAALAITGGQHLVGSGLIISLAGWVAATAGALTAFWIGPSQARGMPRWDKASRPVLTAVTALAALGAVIAYAAPWDHYTLRTANGGVHSATLGNAFSYPGAVIFANVVVMVLVLALAIAAVLWRPARLGAALLAGAVIPLIAQAISAIIQIGQNPVGVFGLTPAEATRLGVSVSAGLTAAFWVYLALVIVLAAIAGWLARPPRQQPRPLAPEPQPPASQHIPA